MIYKFIGADKYDYNFKGDNGKPITGSTYHIYVTSEIKEENGIGVKPMDFKVKYEVYKAFVNDLGIGNDVEIIYQSAYDKNGNKMAILQSYSF